jgi:hypothetical protein
MSRHLNGSHYIFIYVWNIKIITAVIIKKIIIIERLYELQKKSFD